MSHRYLGRHVASRWHWIAGIISGFGLVTNLWAEPIGLLYPEVREPYQKVFLNIAVGAEKQLNTGLLHHSFNKSTTQTESEKWLQAKGVTAVLALGGNSVDRLGNQKHIPFVVGAVSAQAPESYSSVSLNPSPKLLFLGVRELKPTIQTIHVVFDPDRNQWEVEQAQQMAEELGLTLKGYPAADLRQAATTYRDIQDTMNAKTDAVWLPLGGPAREKSIMKNILETAWIKEQVVFSSNLSDVKRGALFAMYPDNVGMGEELAALLQKVQANPEMTPQTHFVTALYKAVNRRTAEHLQIRLGNQELGNYDIVYPPR